MCVIAVCEAGLRLDKEQFRQCFDSNSHGAGFAWMEDGQLAWRKGFMDSKQAWKFYKTINHLPHVAHFRLTSAGGTIKELTHPFLITPESPITMAGKGMDRLLFHNGTITNWQEMVMMVAFSNKSYPVGEMSDTRVMAMSVAIVGEGILDSSKFVIASPTEFKIYGTWEEKEGIHFSNTWFSRAVAKTYVWERDYDKYPKITPNRMYDRSEYVNGYEQTRLPIQLRGSGKVNGNQVEEFLDDDEIFANKVLSNYYGRGM